MRNNRVKIILALIVTVAVMISSTVSVFAAESVITVDSLDWIMLNEGILSYTYPNISIGGVESDDWDNYRELYGSACYFTVDGSETEDFIKTVELNFNSSDFRNGGFYIFTNNVFVYIVNFDSYGIDLYLDSSGHLYFYSDPAAMNSNDIYYVDFYRLSYPFEDIVKVSTKSVGYSNSCDYVPFEYFQYYSAGLLYPNYSTEDVFSYEDKTVVYESNVSIKGDFNGSVVLQKTLRRYVGYMGFSLTQKQIDLLKSGKFVFRFDNTGFITLSDSEFSYFKFGSILADENNYDKGHFTFLSEGCNTVFDTQNVIPACTAYINDYVVKFDSDDFSSLEGISYFHLIWEFASDIPGLFFPGTLEIVEYEKYENDVEHQEILNAISDSSTVIGQAVKDAAEDISGTIEQQMNVLIHGDTGVEKVVIDTSDVDNLVVKQDELVNGIYDDLNNEIKNKLPDGYNDPYDYISDSINNFSSINSSFEFIKDMYDRTVEATGMGAVILFCLSFGFATYAIGRRLS